MKNLMVVAPPGQNEEIPVHLATIFDVWPAPVVGNVGYRPACRCGWVGVVYARRTTARRAWAAHIRLATATV